MNVSDRICEHHRAYAAWNGWRWAGWYVRHRQWAASLRQLWSAYVLGNDGEACQLCGRDYLLWHAGDDLYGRVTDRWPHSDGEVASGLFCLACFTQLAEQRSITLIWLPQRLGSATPDCPPTQALATAKDREGPQTPTDSGQAIAGPDAEAPR
jgi:hypothetical protein